ncbi:MAG: hypothetical protein LBL64_09690 [Treponema sp.]|jgi:hypothetical protein|nr:hypothetical protein [Treponema sp.]
MDRNPILNAMERKAKKIFDENEGYIQDGKRGVLVAQIRDEKNSEQWDTTQRSFGITYRDYNYEDELVINNGTNFDALVHGKIAFSRRTGKNSGTNYYQVLGYESFWRGSVISDDGNCICAFAGFSGRDDQIIAQAGINCYESLKRTGKNLEDDTASQDGDEEEGEETEEEE